MTMTFEAVVFDLDGTLYDTDAMDKANRFACVSAIAEFFELSTGEAERKLDAMLAENWTEAGRPSIYGATRHFGVPDEIIARFQEKHVVPERLLAKDARLSDLMHSLSQVTKISLLTNTRSKIATRALSSLGLNPDDFSAILGGELLQSPKPSVADLRDLLKQMHVQPDRAIAVGDRWLVDLEPAATIGMKTLRVAARDELVRWLEDTLRSSSPTSP